MADIINLQELVDAKLDAQSLEQFINGGVDEEVLTRLSQQYPTIKKLLLEFQKYNGRAYKTYAEMDADKANLSSKTKVTVTNDATESNNGDWQWDGVTFTKSAYDPLQQAKNYADANGLFKPIGVLNTSTKLADEFTKNGWYFFTSSTPAIAAGFPEPTAGVLLVVNISNLVHQKWMPYNSNSEYTRMSATNAVFPPFQKLITDASLESRLADYISKSDIDQYVDKPYEIITLSPNIFDEANHVRNNVYLNSSGTGIINSATGWACTTFIPVLPNTTYTLSGNRGRLGLQEYEVASSAQGISGTYRGDTTPFSFTTTATTNYVVFNLQSASVPTFSEVQLEEGSIATEYMPFGAKKILIDATFIDESEGLQPSHLLTINAALSEAVIRGVVDNTKIELGLSLTKQNTHYQSTVMNFISDTINDVVQRTLADDVAPMRLDAYTVGANHGYLLTRLTANSHGKTDADIGSVWSSNGIEFVIVDIISTGGLSVTSRTGNIDATASTFTHVSGASNTASFSATDATVGRMWFPSIKNRKLNCFVDDNQIDLTKDATYQFSKTVSFLESYSIMKKSDIVEWLIANSGQNHTNYDAVPAYTVSFGYTFDHECGCSIYFAGVGRKTVELKDQMITQSVQLASGNGTVYNYIPKAVEFTTSGFTYNFQNLEAIASKNPSSALFLTAARQEVGANPIDRIVMLNDQVGYATGYLPILDAEPSVRAINAASKFLEIRNGTLKLYPSLIDSAAINSINENDTFACVAYRKYFKRSAERTCKYVVRSKLGDFLYLDWHVAKTDEIELPADLVGRNFTVHEKSSNVTVLSRFASNNLLVNIDNTKSYGYLVLKFE